MMSDGSERVSEGVLSGRVSEWVSEELEGDPKKTKTPQ